jgi:hypothetical protein
MRLGVVFMTCQCVVLLTWKWRRQLRDSSRTVSVLSDSHIQWRPLLLRGLQIYDTQGSDEEYLIVY